MLVSDLHHQHCLVIVLLTFRYVQHKSNTKGGEKLQQLDTIWVEFMPFTFSRHATRIFKFYCQTYKDKF